MYTILSGQPFKPLPSVENLQQDEKSKSNTPSDMKKDFVSHTEVQLCDTNSKNELAKALKISSSSNNTNSIVCLIKTALCDVLLHKPDDPLAYLRQYFQDLRDKRDGKKEDVNPIKNKTINDTKVGNGGKRKEMTRSKTEAISTKIGNKMVRTSRPHSSSDIVTFNR